MNDIQKLYTETVAKELESELGITNIMAVPRVRKIVVNIGVKGAIADKKNLEVVNGVLEQITGQKPKVTRARMSIAGFKLRENDKVGLMVTLRGKRMYDFLEKLIAIVLPRIKDFRGVKAGSFDKQGNYTLGLAEYSVFPEVDLAKIDRMYGMEITMVTNTNKDAAYLLLKKLGMPFQK